MENKSLRRRVLRLVCRRRFTGSCHTLRIKSQPRSATATALPATHFSETLSRNFYKAVVLIEDPSGNLVELLEPFR